MSAPTRRQLAVLFATPLLAQVTSRTVPETSRQPASPAATPEQKRQKAENDVHQASERLSQIEIPMDIEPAFSFRP